MKIIVAKVSIPTSGRIENLEILYGRLLAWTCLHSRSLWDTPPSPSGPLPWLESACSHGHIAGTVPL